MMPQNEASINPLSEKPPPHPPPQAREGARWNSKTPSLACGGGRDPRRRRGRVGAKAGAASLGGRHTGTFGLALGLQFQESAAIVLRRYLDEGGEGCIPVFEEIAGSGAAGEEVVALDQDAQPLGVEAQRVAHTVVDDIRRALARAVSAIGVILALVRLLADRFEIDPGMVAEARETAFRVIDIGDPARHAGGEVAPGLAEHDD